MTTYDPIVIGAGMAGIGAANRCADPVPSPQRDQPSRFVEYLRDVVLDR